MLIFRDPHNRGVARTGRRGLAATAMYLSLTLLVSACAGGGKGGDEASGGNGDTETLRISVPSASAELSQAWLANYARYFKDEGVNVAISVDGGNVATNLASGRADLGITGIGSGLALTNKGKGTSIVYWWSGEGAAGFLIGQPGMKDVADCHKVSTYPEGTSAYGWTQYYAKGLSTDWDVTVSSDVQTQLAGFTSGQFDCVVSSLGPYSGLVEEGKASLIIDRRDEAGLPEKLQELKLVEAAVFGVSDNLKSKSEAVVRFIVALDKARKLIETSTSEKLAEMLLKGGGDGDWAGHTKADLVPAFDAAKTFLAPNKGFIPDDAWDSNQLRFFQSGGLSFIDPDDSKWSYDERVDMSYYKKALGDAG